MSSLTLRFWPDTILQTPCEEVTQFSSGLREAIQEMFAVMDAHEALGLAAPQVGLPWRVFVTNDKGNWVHPIQGQEFPFPLRRAFINPIITPVGKVTKKGEEGCLSFPGVSETVERATHIRVQALDEYGKPFFIEASGRFGVCIQHETDHLNGITMDKRLGTLGRRLFLTAYRKTKR